jgi:oxalate decarboxylase/phosphoglucose isomerase-like protein (cupin superfamily)
MKVITLAEYQQFSSDKMKKNNLFQSPRFFCDVYCFEPGQEQKGHIHGTQDKVYLVLEGQGTFQVGGEKQVLGEEPYRAAAQRAGLCRAESLKVDCGRKAAAPI